ncbi:crossover junction endodeoxyribonuclease RuvC [Bacillus cereus]|uniref:crossover junction endodeoxyribonuclease RuvC n=1 Tax=Bacillus cereus group TaxID=86661 RepID=UPI001BAA4874|nr:crossover junction endodeoxyribonuclease RuvC [Bacillus cereus]MBR9655764.1 hypothetical protein [Bacillus cereus]
MTVTRYVGFDISTSTGYAIIDRVDEGSISKNGGQIFLRHVGVISVPSSYRHQGQTIKYTDGQRLHTLRTTVWEILEAYDPDIYIKEGRAVNFSRFRASEITGKATGIIDEVIEAFTQGATVIFEYKPSTIKKEIAGHGKADKEEVQHGVFHYFSPEENAFPYKNKRDGSKEYNDDATDAVASVLTHFEKNGMKYWTERSRENLL